VGVVLCGGRHHQNGDGSVVGSDSLREDTMGRRHGEVWKAGEREWKVQFPKGIMTYRTKREAEKVSTVFFPEGARR